MTRKPVLTTLCILGLCVLAGAALARNIASPHQYGRVVLRSTTTSPTMDSVRFDHWLHRALYTCRLCHMDIGFAMEANGTGVTEEANRKGLYCGVCHNGVSMHGEKKIFSACTTTVTPADAPRCDRCHSVGKKVKKEHTYDEFTKNLPRRPGGDYIDWEAAEAQKAITPIDTLPSVSIQRPRLEAQKDFAIQSKSSWMPNIIFSHKKHAVWNGCEVCHPDIFPSVKKGTVKYTMLEIAEGRYCGLCHTKVAFPISDCEKCHIGKVR